MRFGRRTAPRSERSAPELNTGPDPVSTTARTAASVVASRNARSNCSRSCADKRVAVVPASPASGSGCHLACCTPSNASVTWRSVGGCPAEDGKGRWYRSPVIETDEHQLFRKTLRDLFETGDRAPRRRVGGGPDLSRPRPLPEAGAPSACSASSTTRPTGAWGRTTRTHDRRRGDGPHQLRRRAHGDRGPDVDVDPGVGPLRLPRAEGDGISLPPSGARSSRPSRSPSPTPAATWPASGPAPCATATSGSSTAPSSTSPTARRPTGSACWRARRTNRGTRACP